MKRNWLGVLFVVLLLTGCSQPAAKTETEISTIRTSETSSTTAKTETPQPTTTETTQTTESNAMAQVLWSNEKKQELAKFMKSWGALMGQDYSAYYPGKDVNFYGFEFPTSLVEQTMTMTIVYQNEPIDIHWSETGEELDRYNLVAVYSDIKEGSMSNHLYLFTIYNRQPLVLITMQNQGNDNNYLYFNQTENTDLAHGFAQVVNQ